MCKKAILLASFVLVLALAPGAGAADLNLVCWWKFDGNANDSSDYARHGTENGGPAYTGGYDGQAIDLDGIDDYVEYSFAEETWSAYTIALWVRTDTLGQDQYSSLFNNNSSGSDFQFDVDGADNYRYRGSDDELFGPVTTDWVHLAATCDGADTTLYFNGNQVATIAAADTVFGRYAVGINRNTTNCFAGDIDDVRIYDRALTPAEIKALAQSGEATLISPADGATLAKASVLLTWERGRYPADVDGHEVYLSDNFEDVDAGSAAASLGLTSNEFYYVPVLNVGKIYYWRIVEVNDLHPGTPWPSGIWSFTVPEATAWDPSPAEGAKFVDPDVTLSWQMGLDGAYHQVYLGQSFEDVNAGAGGTYRGQEYETSYTPGPRLLGTTYYWRIDTVKSDLTVEKGPVWSFTTRPFTPIVDPSLVGWWKLDDEGSSVVAHDYSGYDNHGRLKGDPQWVPGQDGDALQLDGVDDWVAIENLHYDSSGLEEVTVMAWARTTNSGNQAIASFDRSEYWRLEVNGNGAGAGQIGWSVMTDADQVDLGSAKRVDDGQWHHVAGVFDKGTVSIYIDGRQDAQVVNGSTFGTGTTRYGFIGARSEAGSFDGGTGTPTPFAGDLDDVRIYDRVLSQTEIRRLSLGLKASHPSPADGAQYEGTSVMLSWQAGRYVASHDVYFGNDSNSLSLVSEDQPLDSNSFGPVPVELGRTYYWRVDEANDPCAWQGDLWSFEVKDYHVVDDFDWYVSTSGPNEPSLLSTWKDGGANATGSTIFLETDFAGNSMRYVYDNSQAPFNSEAELIYDAAVDWTAGGVKALALEFRGDANNSADWMYAALEDADGNSAAVTYGDTNDLAQESRHVWNIALQDFNDDGVDLTKVKKLIIGFLGSGSGTVYIDDIRLYPPRCLSEYAVASFNDDCVTDFTDLDVILRHWMAGDYDVVAAEPNGNRLAAYYKFDETSGTVANDSSGKDYNATVDPNGANAWDPSGYDGYCLAFDGNFAVSVPNDVFSNILSEVTVSLWVHVDANANPNTIGRAEFGAGPTEANEPWDRLAWIQEKPEDDMGRWSHYAFVKDANRGVMRIYHNGLLVAQSTDAFQLMDGAGAGRSTIGSQADGESGYYKGKLDEFRIYDYALSHAEVLHLASGGGSRLYQPLQPVLSPVDPYEDGRIGFRDFAVLGEWWLKESLWP